MGAKLAVDPITDGPGPGAYQNDKIKNNDLKYSMKARKFDDNKESKQIPGPGSYNPYIHNVVKRDPSFAMPRAERGDVNQSKLSQE